MRGVAGSAFEQVAEGELESGMRFQREHSEDLLEALDFGARGIVAGRGQEIELVLDRIDAMDLGQDRSQLRGHRLAGVRVSIVAQQAARERLALDPLHDEERRAEHGRIIGEPHHLGHGQAFFVCGAQHGEFVATAGVDPLCAAGSRRNTSARLVSARASLIVASKDQISRDAPPGIRLRLSIATEAAAVCSRMNAASRSAISLGSIGCLSGNL